MPHVDGAAIEDVIPADVCETNRRQIHSATRDHAMLDPNVVEVLFFQVSAGFDFNKTPAFVPAAVKHIDAHEHAAVLERPLEYRRNFAVGDQLPRYADRLIQTTDASTSIPPGKSWRASSPTSRPCWMIASADGVWLCREFWLVNLKVEPLQTLAARNKL